MGKTPDTTGRPQSAEINSILAKLPPHTALSVLHKAMGQTLARLEDPPANLPRTGHGNRSRFPWLRPKIDQDAEVKDFIHTLAGTMPLLAMRAEITARFGAERTPSKSAMGRYLLRLEGE